MIISKCKRTIKQNSDKTLIRGNMYDCRSMIRPFRHDQTFDNLKNENLF